MLKIKGIGQKKISVIWEEMGIENIGELLYPYNENRLFLYYVFEKKTQQNVKGLDFGRNEKFFDFFVYCNQKFIS